ncbi:MAG: phage tail terminator protein [Rhodanobacter sp.]
MSAAPFDVALVIAQIKSAAPLLRQVSGAADYAAVKTLRDFAPPCAFVLLATEKLELTPGNTTGHQRATASFGVVVAVRNYRAADRGQQASDELRSVLGQLRSALMGWTPALPGGRPTQLVRGDLVDYDQATLLWTDQYQTQHFIQR